MNLQTQIPIKNLDIDLNHYSKLLLIGSCFAENMGQKLLEAKFNCAINPLSISYNPLSLFNLFQRSLKEEWFNKEDVFFANERYFSFDLHSDFSSLNEEEMLKRSNEQLANQKSLILEADCLFISLGTAWTHIHAEKGVLVNNCHKLPASYFEKMLLSVKDIVNAWNELSKNLQNNGLNNLQVVFTVSPVRHLKDGFHENQLSKSTLLLAVHEICETNANCSYFPSYEIMMDELRDYRFYAKDLVHPSELAIELIWNYFQKVCLSENTRNAVERINGLMNSFHHRPFEPNSISHQKFLVKLKSDLEQAQEDLGINFQSEIAEINHRMNFA